MNHVIDNQLYYLDNFQRVLDWIGERYSDLLADEEKTFLSVFATLPQPSRALFVRMVMRKGTLFRASKLNYAEIGCPVEAARRLQATGWIELDPVLSLDALFDVLSKPEIGAAFHLSLPEQSARKADQLAALRAGFGDPRRFSAWYRDCTDHVFHILVKPLCDRLRLIFFGNFRQDWTEFVLSDLGVVRYEQVEFTAASRGFRTRRDIDHYIELHHCKERFRASAAPESVLRDLPSAPFENDWLNSRRERLMYQIAQHYEKRKDWASAYPLYERCRFPGARARAIRVLEKNKQYAHAYRLLLEAQRAPESEAERQQLLRISPRLTRQLGRPTTRAPRRPTACRLDLRLPHPGDGWWVEGVVRDHLARPEAPVFYVENMLVNTLFGLLCWRAVFSAIPGAFFHPFHRGPADLYSPDFVQRRAAEFDACLAELDTDAWRATIRATAAAKRGIASPFVAWDGVSDELLELALDCIPAAHLKKMCERILQDVQANRTGFPDLIQFWPAERRYNMIEVKGPGDRLQDNQLRWIDYCAQHQLPVSVCYLQWQEPAA
ncbi:VRR-NUC domain-containing protein [Massilia sp. R2A-15]|uniref:VRR-NUC domain-containing protein n=1 Tax=Massilia sp. R2A-15 TaxID=3064278 RepID=UPI00273605C1|nr:VRR-NUC domain-containing protein [Massilia sp. R2A-15]WLI90688.1 VRR-NUC domain-containing protein [Massilia sp. R2A-15]